MNRLVGWLVTSDTHVFHYVNQQMRCRAFDYILPKLTHLGGATSTISSLLLIMLLSGEIVRSWAIQALISLTVSHIIVHFIKKAYCRERPYRKLENVNLSSSPLKDYSFPSGHTTAAFSIVIVFSMYSLALAILLLPLAVLIGFSRMYLGLHFPTDCIIGALIGTLSSVLVVYSSSVFF
ncbi:phosphatase PAP2 family protein [Evansella tamaricis]|uniref:Phosphatase PAP2 family protein n=1 Tax=Evansella tamaricis TaxID=2069301 RepID=A0ABS6JJE1_9BACI|nr:phosphatase PAP2 family protein [Evansella tamaricis]MBU9713758.1 phosphatase PAP2 family protein [Evansella tamaricis]